MFSGTNSPPTIISEDGGLGDDLRLNIYEALQVKPPLTVARQPMQRTHRYSIVIHPIGAIGIESYYKL